jgi:hypothetical protein
MKQLTPTTIKETTAQGRENNQVSEENKRLSQMGIPIVAFPYITDINDELEANFESIDDQLQVLPCEIESRAVDLPSLLPRRMKTLVLALDDTLVHIQGLNQLVSQAMPKRKGELVTLHKSSSGIEMAKVCYRPRVREFLQALAEEFELIVSGDLTENRSFQRAARTKQLKYSRN